MARKNRVERPIKAIEFHIVFGSRQAEVGWRNLTATIRNPLADTWDFLTRTPTLRTPTNYPLRGDFAQVTYAGTTYERWQHKPTIGGDARIWFYVDDHTVVLEQVHTKHPNQTK